ncbi:hypothetical protein AVEN_129507-1 [Araneus ventricosus]|uniref:Uncharacterized protein n=1 Tax=Araneus ventricosus TaxID=182803 RepID=A0A4Y2FZ47_ARAVE|nr:hypothetical protein AVEN_129507-1 [Araneus ventricosus]
MFTVTSFVDFLLPSPVSLALRPAAKQTSSFCLRTLTTSQESDNPWNSIFPSPSLLRRHDMTPPQPLVPITTRDIKPVGWMQGG